MLEKLHNLFKRFVRLFKTQESDLSDTHEQIPDGSENDVQETTSQNRKDKWRDIL